MTLASTNPLIKRKLDTRNSKLDEVEKNDSEQFGSYNKYNIQTRATAFPSIPLMSSENSFKNSGTFCSNYRYECSSIHLEAERNVLPNLDFTKIEQLAKEKVLTKAIKYASKCTIKNYRKKRYALD